MKTKWGFIMKKEDLLETLNIGIPVYTPLDINTANIIRCTKNRNEAAQIKNKVFAESKKRLEELTNIQVNNGFNNPIMNMSFNSTMDTSKSDLYINNRNLANNIYSNIIETENSKNINKELLKEKLNYLYNKICYLRNHSYTTELHNDLKDNINDLYYNCYIYSGEDLRTVFLPKTYNYYTRVNKLLSNSNNNIIETEDLCEELLKVVDPKLVADFIARKYLEQAEYLIANGNDNIEELMFFVDAYLKHNNNNSIRDKYEQLKRTYDKLKRINGWERDIFLNKTYENNIKVINNILNIKEGKVNTNILKTGPKPETNYKENIKREHHIVTEEDLNQINESINDKLYFYYSLNPIEKINGKNALSNYLCFLYENGMIIADRIYNINTINQIKSDALFVFNANNFENLIEFNKKELRRIIPSHNHTFTWKEKVNKHIEKETSPELHESAKKLALKLEETKKNHHI